MDRDERIIPGSVVQLNEHASAPCYVGCLLLVTEVRAWGVQGFIAVPQERDKLAAQIWLRPKWGEIEYIGEAIMRPAEEEAEHGS